MFTRASDEVSCPTLPGRPVTCVNPQRQTCPSRCGTGLIPCGLMRREDGQLLVGSDGSPLPNCVAPDSSFALCTQPNFRPLSTSFTGGNSSSSWNGGITIRIQGTSHNNKANAATIANIGSSVLPSSSIPAFFAGNSDTTIVVEVSTSTCCARFSVSRHFSAVCRCSSAGLDSAVLPLPMHHFHVLS
jgi:hypothetical protein